jgi:hypothetical protein
MAGGPVGKIQRRNCAITPRARLPQLTESAVLNPLTAIDTYLTEVAPERKDRLLSKAKEIMGKLTAEISGTDSKG